MLIAGLCFHTDATCCRQFRGTMAEWFAAQYKSDDEDSSEDEEGEADSDEAEPQVVQETVAENARLRPFTIQADARR